MLALAASYGVYHFARFFVPDWVAKVQAASFEMTYIGLAINQAFDPDQRRRAVKISVGAVAVSIIYNSLSGFFTTQPHVLEQLPWPAWALLAVLHGAPLAWVAYLVSDLLLHSGNGRWMLLRVKEWQCALREQWIETLQQQLHAVRGELARAVQMAAQVRDVTAHEQATGAHHQAKAEQLRAELAQQAQVVAQGAQEGAQLRADLVHQAQAAAQTLQELAQVRAKVAHQAQAAAQWRAAAERLRATARNRQHWSRSRC